MDRKPSVNVAHLASFTWEVAPLGASRHGWVVKGTGPRIRLDLGSHLPSVSVSSCGEIG